MQYYTSSLQHILAELERVDLMLRVRIWYARQVKQSSDPFAGLYLSDEAVDALLARPLGAPFWSTAPTPLSLTEADTALQQIGETIAQFKQASLANGVKLRLEILRHLFALSPLDMDVLLIVLAPELDVRYGQLYAYLQDDVTRKHPSVDLILNLICTSFEDKLAGRSRFEYPASLVKHRLIQLFDSSSPQPPTLLSQFVRLDRRIASYLLDSDEIDNTLSETITYRQPEVQLSDVVLPDDLRERLQGMLWTQSKIHDRRSIFYFQGDYGVGKRTTAEALCHDIAMGMVMLDGRALSQLPKPDFTMTLRLVLREALLQEAALYWQDFDLLFEDEHRHLLDSALKGLAQHPGLIFLAGNTVWEPSDVFEQRLFVRIEFARPEVVERVRFWQMQLNDSHIAKDIDLFALATKFRFTPGQIRDAVATARSIALTRDPQTNRITERDLYAASRLQSNRNLSTLARKITPHYQWDDIILPDEQLQQLLEIHNHVHYRAVVYQEWGFDSKLSLGKGLNVIFFGASGTGKTMAAEIIAGALGLDLYKIDLSTMVSKYIGETEKNLARIFKEAETSNAILFFDEADALFGKRSEVQDSHDRYANIQVSYLLQRMEEYDGVVILTTNLRKNMDEAFVRRMHFIVDFPFPNAYYRRQIWERVWPSETPLAKDVDLDFMARRFEIAGGNIRNIALAAAFLAADDGRVVQMQHLIRATRREYQKMGKVMVEATFGEYDHLT
ncbi:MAG: AAA family ATPase [Chloroflexi bacterium]|nr:MAG: AAA family ATPase [Chloroflexota bacterium]